MTGDEFPSGQFYQEERIWEPNDRTDSVTKGIKVGTHGNWLLADQCGQEQNISYLFNHPKI